MKFLRQTKETKRKISFLLVLALVFSLLPVSPVAKAKAENKVADVYVEDNVSGASIQSVTSVATGTVTVVFKADAKNTFTNDCKSNITVTAKAVTAAGVTHTPVTLAAITNTVTASNGAIVADRSNINIVNPGNAGNTMSIVVKNITSGGSIIVSGSAVVASTSGNTTPTPTPTSGDTTPTPTPTPTSGDTTPTPTPTPTSGDTTPTPTPIPTFMVTIDTSKMSQDLNCTAKSGDDNFTSGNSVEKGKQVSLTITAKKENAAIKELPEVKWNSENVQLDKDGNTCKYSAAINAETTIIISGGSIIETADIASNQVDNKSEVKKEETGIDEVKTEIDDVQNLANVIVGNVDNKDEVNTALKNGATISTLLTVAKSTDNDEKAAKENVTVKNTLKEILKELATASEEENVSKILENKSVYLDISLKAVVENNGKKIAELNIETLGDGKGVKVTMSIPKKLDEKKVETGYKRNYFVIRIHNGMAEKIENAQARDGKITFTSDKFSTYIIGYEDVLETVKPSPTTSTKPGNPALGGGGGGSATTPTPAPTTSTAPSASPSVSPAPTTSAAPSASTEPGTSAKPGDGGTTPAESTAPSSKPNDGDNNNNNNNNEPGEGNNNNSSSGVKEGKKYTVNKSTYKVVSNDSTKSVKFTGTKKKNATKIVIPSTVKIKGNTYKVKFIADGAFKNNKKLKKVTIGANVQKIGKNAFKGCKNLKSIVIKTKKLTKSKVGSNAFKGINNKATIKVPKSKVKAYKKIVKAKGASKNVKVKK